MVIVIYSKDEIVDYIKVKEREKQIKEKCDNDITNNDSCIETEQTEEKETKNKATDNNNSNNEKTKQEEKLVNINTATKEELMTISGIGSSKADAIISYRKDNKFEKIEDIKNVSGIGDSLYEKIKDFITT